MHRKHPTTPSRGPPPEGEGGAAKGGRGHAGQRVWAEGSRQNGHRPVDRVDEGAREHVTPRGHVWRPASCKQRIRGTRPTSNSLTSAPTWPSYNACDQPPTAAPLRWAGWAAACLRSAHCCRAWPVALAGAVTPLLAPRQSLLLPGARAPAGCPHQRPPWRGGCAVGCGSVAPLVLAGKSAGFRCTRMCRSTTPQSLPPARGRGEGRSLGTGQAEQRHAGSLPPTVGHALVHPPMSQPAPPTRTCIKWKRSQPRLSANSQMKSVRQASMVARAAPLRFLVTLRGRGRQWMMR